MACSRSGGTPSQAEKEKLAKEVLAKLLRAGVFKPAGVFKEGTVNGGQPAMTVDEDVLDRIRRGEMPEVPQSIVPFVEKFVAHLKESGLGRPGEEVRGVEDSLARMVI